jgi:hypothetical protein
VKLYKAQAIPGQTIPDLSLSATEEATRVAIDAVCPYSEFDARRRAFYDEQAGHIADALYASIPGGTIDALLVRLLDRRRSVLIVRHEDRGGLR